jgi:hypothetical protein
MTPGSFAGEPASSCPATRPVWASLKLTSTTFRTIPDVPIRRLDLVLPEGKRSILAASSGPCTKKRLTMLTAINGQNGARVKPTVKVAVSGCKKPKKKRHPKKKPHPTRRKG